MIEQKTLLKRDQVRDYLLSELRNGRRKPGSIFLSENEVIRKSGFSKNTVREAFSMLVSDGLLERIQGKGTFVRNLDPIENGATASSKTVHLIIGNPIGKNQDDPFIGRILYGLHSTLDTNGWQIQVKFIEPATLSSDIIRKLAKDIQDTAWVILAGFDYSHEVISVFEEFGIRPYTIGRPESTEVPFIESDHTMLAYDAVNSLVSRGHTRIALADRRISHAPSFDSRRNGYIKALSKHGILPDARLMAEYRKFNIDAGQEVWDILRGYGQDFTALICYGDWATYGVIQCATKAGIRVPEDLSLITVSGSPVMTPELLVERYDFPTLGEEAGKFLLELESGTTLKMKTVKSVLFSGTSICDIKNNH